MPNNSEIASPGRISSVKVVNLSLAAPQTGESLSNISVYFSTYPNESKSEQASAPLSSDFRSVLVHIALKMHKKNVTDQQLKF